MADKLAVIQSEETIKELNNIDVKVNELIGTFNNLVTTTNKVNSGLLSGKPKDFMVSEKQAIALEKQYLTLLEKREKVAHSLAVIEDKSSKLAAQNKAIEVANEAKLQEQRERSRLSEIKLQQQREKTFDDFERKKQAAEAQRVRNEQKQKADEERKLRDQEKARLAEIRLEQQREKHMARMEKEMSAYNQLNKLHVETRNAARDAGVQHGIMSKQFLEAAAKANEYDKRLKQVDYSLGQFNRNVGNYHGNMFGLNAQMAQVMREMPNFAIDARIGIMSLTNNLPYLGDAIADVARKNKELKAEFKLAAESAKANAIETALKAGQDEKAAIAAGKHAESQMMLNYQAQKGPSVMKQVIGSIFSWQTLLIVGVTLLMTYNKQITEWVSNLFKGKTAAEAMRQATKDLNEAKKEGNKNAAQEIVNAEMLYRIMKDETVARKDRLGAAKELQDLYPQIFGNMSTEQMLIADTTEKYKELRSAIIAAAMAEAVKNKIAEATSKFLDKEQENLDKIGIKKHEIKRLESGPQSAGYMSSGGTGGVGVVVESTADRTRWANEELNELRKIRERDTKNYQAYVDKMYKIGQKYQIEGDKTDKPDKTKTPKPKAYTGSKLTGQEKDAIDLAIAERDNAIARIKEQKVEMEINEAQYWEGYITIQKGYRAKILKILDDDNAKKQRITAQARRKAIEEIEKANKEIYDYEVNALEAQKKLWESELNAKQKLIENDEYILEVERIKQQQAVYDEILEKTKEFYEAKIQAAKENAQELINIEAERDTAINNIETKKQDNASGLSKAMLSDADYYKKIEEAYRSASDANERAAIFANSKLNAEEQSYLLSILEAQQTIDNLEYEKQRLELRETELNLKDETGKLTTKETTELAETVEKLAKINENIAQTKDELDKIKLEKFRDMWDDTLNLIKNGFNDIGFPNLANQVDSVFKEIVNGTFDWKDATILAAAAIGDALQQLNQSALENRLAALDEELARSQEVTDQEIGFIEKRIEWMNSLGQLNAEQIAERNALEDEARVYREQQEQREKMIAAQKARAQQKAAAQSAMINGAAAAAKTLAELGVPLGIAPAAVALGFGMLQAGFIMARNPVPEYFVGRNDGPREWALTQERGREIITDRHGNIKSLGHDKGAELTFLEQGDKVFTAGQTKDILKRLDSVPEVGDNIYHSMVMKRLNPVIVQQVDNSEKLISGFESALDRKLSKYDKPVMYENENGELIYVTGNRIPENRGKRRVKTIKVEIRKNGRD